MVANSTCIIQSSPLSVNNYDLQLPIMFGFSSAYLPTTEQQILTFAFIGCSSQQDKTASVASPQRNDFLIQFIRPRDNLNCQSHRYSKLLASHSTSHSFNLKHPCLMDKNFALKQPCSKLMTPTKLNKRN